MVFRRKTKAKITGRKPRRKIAKTTKVSTVKTLIRKALRKEIEVKKSNYTSTDGVEIGHNSFMQLDNQLLTTTQGNADPAAAQIYNRVGDQVTYKGMQIKMMLELNERYSDVTYRIFLVKSSKGDNPTTSGLFWNGLSGNKMLDTVNTERYTIMFQKYGKIKAGNFGGQTASTGALLGGGLFDVGGTNVNLYSRQTKIVTFNLSPKLMKLGKITYDGNGNAQKFFDYTLFIYAYSNYTTSELLGFNVLRVNDYIRTMYFTDS